MKHLFGSIVAVMALGCGVEPAPFVEGGVTARAFLSGTIGGQGFFYGEAEAVKAENPTELTYTDVTISRQEPDVGFGMVIFSSLDRNIDDFIVGEQVVITKEDVNHEWVSVCTGPSGSSIQYDRRADEAIVDVSDIPGGRNFNIKTTVIDPDTGEVSNTESSFDIQVPAAE
jgi:hypothetical protein